MKSGYFYAFSILFCLLGATTASAQIEDNFNDGNFTTNPVWQGDAANFQINAAQELQLNAPTGGVSQLWTQGNITDSTIWLLDFRLDFAPSATNKVTIMLLADQPALTANGYYVEMGEDGSADAFRFYRQDASGTTLLATGVAGFGGGTTIDMTLRIKRTTAGVWTCIATSAGGPIIPQFEVSDATIGGATDRWFGLICTYTATRKDKFFFDNISILPDVPDTTPPVLASVEALSSTSLQVDFSEALDSTSALAVSNFNVQNGPATSTATWSRTAPQRVVLTLAAPLATGTWTLATNNIRDAAGNQSTTQTLDFQYINVAAAGEFDLLINEIMPDPDPSVGLPAGVEWIELLNRSNKIIALQSLRISDGGTPVVLPERLLYPNDLVVICATDDVQALSPFAGTALAGVAALPSLNNTGDVLTLSTVSGTVIDRVAYEDSWHTDNTKREGGWSLERINPTTPCLGRENWQSCPGLPGGTPGLPNQSLNLTPDNTPPTAIQAFPISATQVRLKFSEGLDVATIAAGSFVLLPSGSVVSASAAGTDRSTIIVTLDGPLQGGVLYELVVLTQVSDCAGNGLTATDTLRFGRPERPDYQDIIFNEVLFNPASGGSRFIELYNQSQKIINLENCTIANFFNGANLQPIEAQRLFFPGTYLVITADPTFVADNFDDVRTQSLVSATLPSMDDRLGHLQLIWTEGPEVVVADSFNYSSTWHNALLSIGDQEGVSLERIRFDQPTNSRSNWTSAARNGTPTLPNSQALGSSPTPTGDDLVTLASNSISPDGDGYEDFIEVSYEVPNTGYAYTSTIYDSEGTVVRNIARQELIGTSGTLRWDGNTNDGNRANPGIHILYMELFAPNGEVIRVKKVFAVVF
jgi:Lamin Tail Domain/Bacterial Ig-like domain